MRKLLFTFCLLIFGLRAFAEKPNGIIVLLTDLGSADVRVGAMKGAIYSAFPEARLDALTLEAPPGNVREGAYLLARTAAFFPSGTVFCVVVGAQSGIKQKSVAVEAENGSIFVAPDNGVLTLILHDLRIKKAHQILNPVFLRDANSVSSPFPERDIYGPAAAALAQGADLESAGPLAGPLVVFEVTEPKVEMGDLVGEVEHIDAQGSLVTNLPQALAEKFGIVPGRTAAIRVGTESLEAPVAKGAGDVHQGSWVVFFNGLGVLEISRNQANANAFLQSHAGTIVKIRLKR